MLSIVPLSLGLFMGCDPLPQFQLAAAVTEGGEVGPCEILLSGMWLWKGSHVYYHK